MAEGVQDEEQWLYGDDKDNEAIGTEKEGVSTTDSDTITNTVVVKRDPELSPEKETEEKSDATAENREDESGEPEKENSSDNQKEGQEDESSSDDEPTVTIGKIVKQPDIVRPLPAHRAAPTSGLKPEDFSTPGKVNGVPVTEFNLAELEEKPWRKPGADLSDYFNYGFTEETWIQYCERQKAMRVHESAVGLTSLGINIGKSGANVLSSVMNENSKYSSSIPTEINGVENQAGNTIQVMTADRRVYSNKVMNTAQPFDNMDFGLHLGQDFFNVPPPTTFFAAPPPSNVWMAPSGLPPPIWRPPETMDIPPPTSVSVPAAPPPGFYNKEMAILDEMRENSEDSRERERDSRRDSLERDRERDRDRDRERDSRRHRRRSRSRSQSRSRYRKRSRSRSRSPRSSRSPHKHKRKKSKRD